MKRSVWRFALIAFILSLGAVRCLAASDAPDAAEQSPTQRAHALSDSASLDLDRVLRRVLERNPTIAAARAAWSEAKARADQGGALEDPMLDVMGAPGSFGSSDVGAAYRIGITQPIPLRGQRGLRRRVGAADSRAAAWALRTAQLDLVHEARMRYVDYGRILRAVTLNRDLLGILPELRRVSLAKYAAGLVGQQDPLQIDAELAMLDHEAVILERQRLVAVATLNVLMREPPENWLPPPPDSLPLPDTSLVHADLAPKARALRPELRAVDSRVEASRAGVTLAARQRVPETSFGVAYGRFWSEPQLRMTLGMTMSLPINRGRISASRTEARARLEASEARREVVGDSIELQVATAAARLHEQVHDVRIARERMLPLAERAFKASRASYEANRADFLTVLNSLRGFLQARLEADQSVATLHEVRADLDRALGSLPSELQTEKLP